jgi:hypothetical protein
MIDPGLLNAMLHLWQMHDACSLLSFTKRFAVAQAGAHAGSPCCGEV